eukprot:g1821.t1
MEPLSTPNLRPNLGLGGSASASALREPFSTPVKTYEPRSRELQPLPLPTYGSPPNGKDTSWLRTLEQQLVDRLRKDAYLLSTLKRSMRKERRGDSDLARRRFSEECAQKIGSLKEELEQHRQSGRQSERHLRQEWKSGLGSLNEKVEALRLDLGAAKEKLSVRPREFRDDQKLQNAMQEITELGNDLYELKRQVKQQSVDLLKRRDTQDDLVENAGLRVTGLEEQVRSMKLQVAQLLHLREKVSKLSNWQQGEASSSVEERMAQLEGRLQAQSRKSSPSRSPRQEHDSHERAQRGGASAAKEESLWAKQVAVISAQQERNCEQLAIFEEKLTNLWTLTPRICQLEDQQKDFWRLQEPASSFQLELAEQRQANCERRVDQLKAELTQYSTSLVDARDEMRKMISQQNDHFSKLTGFLDRFAGLERLLHEKAPESQKLKTLWEENTATMERRLNLLERQLKEGQARSLDTSRWEHLVEGLRRPLESRMSSLELQLENQPPAPEPRLAAMERKLREGQDGKHSAAWRSAHGQGNRREPAECMLC